MHTILSISSFKFSKINISTSLTPVNILPSLDGATWVNNDIGVSVIFCRRACQFSMFSITVKFHYVILIYRLCINYSIDNLPTENDIFHLGNKHI